MDMRNKYGGFCELCKKWVEKGDGHFERNRGRWLVKHFDCVLEDRKKKEEEKFAKTKEVNI